MAAWDIQGREVAGGGQPSQSSAAVGQTVNAFMFAPFVVGRGSSAEASGAAETGGPSNDPRQTNVRADPSGKGIAPVTIGAEPGGGLLGGISQAGIGLPLLIGGGALLIFLVKRSQA